MTDIALVFDQQTMLFDLQIEDGDLLADSGLYTPMVVSLFTDAMAQNGDQVPEAAPGQAGDIRGWWPQAVTGQGIGSRLWLLWREKELPLTLARARQYAQQALAWLSEQGIVLNLAVEADNPVKGLLQITAQTGRPQGENIITENWSLFFDYSQARLVFTRS